ncbi:helix-turn-helix domain-containing protein [Massilia sp. IC2-278]|uniref:helix-turn-helix domain-containing protein n=1 Tax=Massilia sp. IC2-278 TaxID=2887200 RepID=UPI001E54F1DF|nr:helix-turn-helix transcriptional regulator [Massilia sp. IC2-278]MCC2961053.1 helix-turn-helix domain-containing protein [Massilia sp. IC2-278]
MDSEAFVQLALQSLHCSQRELASRIGVSPTQISKWKKGEHMSADMEEKFRTLIQIGDKEPRFVLLSGSLTNATKWEKLIQYLARIAQENAETGYNTTPLYDEDGQLCADTFRVLMEMGITPPNQFPTDLDFDYEGDEGEKIEQILEENFYAKIIYAIFCSLNDVYGFYAAYISELIWDDELELLGTKADNIEPCLLELAASKIKGEHELTQTFRQFRRSVQSDYEEWLTLVKDRAFRNRVPLRAELLNLVRGANGEIGEEAEAESLGFNSSRIHPDIYMNELLVGMRVIHQVLPAILKKLGLEDEFKLDESELRLN